jgi:hypothetical protein
MASSLALSQIFSTIWLNKKIKENNSQSKIISLFTISQNIIWNAYGSLCHFYFAVNNNDIYMIHFAIPSFLFFTNFSIFESSLIYSLWKYQNIEDLNDLNIVRKKLIKFYLTFYVMLFSSFFLVFKFYFEPEYIAIALILTWIPQIFHNAFYNNQAGIPLINILLISLNKLVIPIYFRGYTDNIFHIKTSISYVYLFSAIILFEIFFVQLQSVWSPRFFIPCKFYSNTHQIYKTKDELLATKNEYEYSECAICLNALISSECEKGGYDFFIDKYREPWIKIFFSRLYNIFFDFHEFSFNKSKKPYMMTPCLHAFHSKCLEDWLKQKRECPTDRSSIPAIYN